MRHMCVYTYVLYIYIEGDFTRVGGWVGGWVCVCVGGCGCGCVGVGVGVGVCGACINTYIRIIYIYIYIHRYIQGVIEELVYLLAHTKPCSLCVYV